MRYANKYYVRHEPRTLEEKALVNRYTRLNAIFVARRDSGRDIEQIYSRLKATEQRITAARVWSF
jgi:hypothetical protein